MRTAALSFEAIFVTALSIRQPRIRARGKLELERVRRLRSGTKDWPAQQLSAR